MERKKPDKMKKLFSRIFTMICIVVFSYSLYELSGIGLDYYYNRQVLAEAQEIYNNGIEQKSASDDQSVRKQFLELQEFNEDIIGWIQIDGTKINYPILQAENNTYYLDRNYKREQSRAGSIFADYRNHLTEENKNFILYGHRMKDETMFNQLTKYLDEDFFDTHSIIHFDTLYHSYDAIVFSAYYTTTDFDYIQTDFDTEEEFQSLVDEMKNRSVYATDVSVQEDDTILTLSTCDYTLDPDEGRFVVHAKLVDREK